MNATARVCCVVQRFRRHECKACPHTEPGTAGLDCSINEMRLADFISQSSSECPDNPPRWPAVGQENNDG